MQAYLNSKKSCYSTIILTNTPKGLFYYNGYVPIDIEQDICEWFSSPNIQSSLFPVANARGKSSRNARKVLHYGWRYNYTSGTREKAPSFPPVLNALRNILKIWEDGPKGFDLLNLDQCIVNRYLPGQGIGAHIDSSSYGDVIACFTFGGGREMEFTRGTEKYRLYTTKNSLYVMSGEARGEWKHQMRPRKSDTVGGTRVSRIECFSVTFRSGNVVSDIQKCHRNCMKLLM